MLKPDMIKYLEELVCSTCSRHLGYVISFDLQGSSFFCDECVERVKKPKPQR